MADEKAKQQPQQQQQKAAPAKDDDTRAAGQDAEPGTQEHLGSDRPYEGADPEDN